MAHVMTFNAADEILMNSLKNSGCFELFIGIESGSPKILSQIKKTKNLDTIINNISKAFKAGINIKGYFIYGFPNETIEDMDMTYKLAETLKNIALENNVNFRTSVFQYRPYHATQIYHDLETQGRDLKVQPMLPDANLSSLVGRLQFNFHSGNFSKVKKEVIDSYIYRTINLNGGKISPGLTQSILPCRKKCKACGLYLNQLPLFDNYKQSQIFWLGLSAVQVDDVKSSKPLSSETASGNLISMIEEPYLHQLQFYKTNLVKCLPLKNDKIRYPIQNEMEKCFPNFELEIKELKPTIVFLLGKQVSSFISKKYSIKLGTFSKKFKYEPFLVNGITFIPIHHPSYILVYKRKFLKKYISQIQLLFSLAVIKSSLKKKKAA